MGPDIERSIKYRRFTRAYKHLFVRLFILFLLSAIGGFIFRWAEGTRELEYKCGVKKVRRDFIDSLWKNAKFMDEDDWKAVARRRLLKFEDELHNAFEEGMDADSGTKTWNFVNAVFYSMTLMTTIGYGHISPITLTGKLFTVLYSIIGIPIFTIIMCDAGKVMTLAIKLFLTRKPEHRKAYTIDDEFNLPMKTALSLLVGYSLGGALFFYILETEWGFWGSLYFVFVTFSTVGLGDLVPENPITAVLTSVYFLFGLALTSLVIGTIQEKLEAPLNSITRRFAFLVGLGPSQSERVTKPSDGEFESGDEHVKGE